MVAAALALIIDHEKLADEHTFQQVTGNYTFTTHDPAGDTFYGIEVFVVPAMRGRRLARRRYAARRELCERLNLRAINFGARIAGYHEYQATLSPKEYVRQVRDRAIMDLVLNFQLANYFHPVRVLRNYRPGDEASGDYALLMAWDNMLYHTRPVQPVAQKTQVRPGLVQWQMRLYDGLEDLFQQVEYFVDALAAYRADFALFPELFHGPLMAETNEFRTYAVR